MAQIPPNLRGQLVASMPDLPGILLFVISVASLAIGMSTIVCLPRIYPQMVNARIQAYIPRINKAAICLMGLVLAFGMTGASKVPTSLRSV
jgi:hypothetical protein